MSFIGIIFAVAIGLAVAPVILPLLAMAAVAVVYVVAACVCIYLAVELWPLTLLVVASWLWTEWRKNDKPEQAK